MSIATDHTSKNITRDEAVKIRVQARAQGKTVGYTSGVFDLLHSGHVAYLAQAAAKVDLLIVGLNSDSSVRKNKGELRPIRVQAERSALLAGLASVAYVFIFDEPNNNTNIELLKPDYYFKAGDYAPDKLSSAPIVEKYGGQVEIIPFREGESSSAIIETIVERYAGLLSGASIKYERAPAVFIDRDGTIIEHVEFIHDPEQVKLVPGAAKALVALRDAGFRLVLVTNQPGIGLGYFTKEDFFRVNRAMLRAIRAEGASLDKAYFCPHSEVEACECRKPNPSFLHRAVKELNIDLKESFVIGDMTGDIALAENAGCRSVLVQTGFGGSDKRYAITANHTAHSLVDAAEWIISVSKK